MKRIRRIKCDEGKPSCTKCLSTGRVCDGYSLTILVVDGPQQARLAKSSKTIAPPFSLPLGFLGTETERNFFHTCRRATEAGVALHICSRTSFWTRLAPQLSHEYEAVRHAVVAVGAAYHLHKVADIASIPRSTKERIEAFILEQYNRSICILHRDINRERFADDSTIVLICCLAYIYLESLRSNYSAAIRHLNNGIRIIESTVDVQTLSNRMSVVRRKKQGNTALSDSEMWETILEFRNCELCMHCFSSEVPMTLGSRLCGKLPVNNNNHSEDFTSIASVHEARLQMASEVMSRDWQWRHFKHQREFWIQTHIQQELSWFREKSEAIRLSLLSFMSSENSPSKESWEYYSMCMDMLHITCILAVIQLIPVAPEDHAIVTDSRYFQTEFVDKMIEYGEEMHAVHNSLGWPPPDISLETAIIGPMYWVYVYSLRPQNKQRAIKILRETRQREGPWDAKQTLAKLTADSSHHQKTGTRKKNKPTLRKWGGEANCYS